MRLRPAQPPLQMALPAVSAATEFIIPVFFLKSRLFSLLFSCRREEGFRTGAVPRGIDFCAAVMYDEEGRLEGTGPAAPVRDF